MKTLNPTWNEAFAFKGVLGTLIQKPLSVKCYDYDKMAMNDALGEISFSLEPLKLKPDVRGTDFPLGKARARRTLAPTAQPLRHLLHRHHQPPRLPHTRTDRFPGAAQAKSGSITFEIKWTPTAQR